MEKSIRKCSLYLLTFSIIYLSGCAYLENRLRDFGDIVYADVTVGYGVQIHAQATWIIMGGVKYGYFERFGYGYGTFIHTDDKDLRDNNYGVTLGLGCSPIVYINIKGPTAYFFFPVEFQHPTNVQIINPFNTREDIFYPDGNTDISFALHIIYFGLEFRVKLNELLDFILGFSTLDIQSDDNTKHGNPNNIR